MDKSILFTISLSTHHVLVVSALFLLFCSGCSSCGEVSWNSSWTLQDFVNANGPPEWVYLRSPETEYRHTELDRLHGLEMEVILEYYSTRGFQSGIFDNSGKIITMITGTLHVMKIDPQFSDVSGTVPPLVVSVILGDQEKVKSLIEDKKSICEPYQYGWTPLHFAVQLGRKRISELLIRKGADANAISKEGWTPLHGAVRFGLAVQMEQ